MAFPRTTTAGVLAALTIAGASFASSSAQAQYGWGGPRYTYAGYRHYPRYGYRYAYAPRRYYVRRHYNPGAAIAGLAFGALTGAAIAGSYPYYYGYPAYGYPYGYRWGGPVYTGYYSPWW
jgi:hypothetical protein